MRASLTIFFVSIVSRTIACGAIASEDRTADTADASAARDASTTFGDAAVAPTDVHVDAATGSCGEYLGNRDMLEQFAAAQAVGVYTVVQKDEECSGLGGTHVTFELRVPCAPNTAPTLVHWGGHGCHSARSFVVGDAFVVAFESFDPPAPTPGWCIDKLPPATAKAGWIENVKSVEDGTNELRGLGCPVPLGGR